MIIIVHSNLNPMFSALQLGLGVVNKKKQKQIFFSLHRNIFRFYTQSIKY